MPNLSKNKKLIYAIIILIVVAVVLTIKPWVKKPVKVTATQLGEMSVLNPVLSTDDQNVLYYDLNASNLYEYNLKAGKATQLSENLTDTPDSLIWSPDRSQVIIKILNDKTKFKNEGSVFANAAATDGATMLWNYNLTTKKLAILNPNIKNSVGDVPANPVWTSDSQQIIYCYADQNNVNSLYIANADGSNQQKLGGVPADLYSIYIYDSKNKIVYYSTPIDQETEIGQIYQYNLATSKKTEIGANNNFGLALDDHRFIYGSSTSTNLYDTTSGVQKALPINIDTWRAAISSNKNNLIAAVWIQKTGEYYFENINLQNLNLSKILDSNMGSSANYTNLNIDSSGNIFFINNKNLFEIKK